MGCPLIATDGFEYYLGAVARLFGSACVYGQVLKTRRNNRVVRVERRVKVGTANRLKAALLASEDSETLNTSFVERLNLTIRQASAYLRRRSPCHARDADQLCSHVGLVRCHYNFVRPHRALRFGRETRTPAMQAGLVTRRLALSDIFTGRLVTLRVFVAIVDTAAAGRRRSHARTNNERRPDQQRAAQAPTTAPTSRPRARSGQRRPRPSTRPTSSFWMRAGSPPISSDGMGADFAASGSPTTPPKGDGRAAPSSQRCG